MTVFDYTNYKQAHDWLNDGKLLAYPTEAVWGLGCDPFNKQAVLDLLKLKNRKVEKGLIVLAPNITSVHDFLQHIPKQKQQVILKSWLAPKSQATTWLFPIPAHLIKFTPNWITGGQKNLAIRVISHPLISKICQNLISPSNPYGFLTSTSCNLSNLSPATTLHTAKSYFSDCQNVAFLQDETLKFNQPSQIRHALTGEIVRE
ncbi:SUA5/yciO/yrdC-like protein [Moraxella macacae 0408225]|uniref:Threonylcarbamoyl-AMP synthase n=1 Tax=Moraxella macacae 0408225 TaxID=1230338 RepID=L2F7Z9_9GAMM|nr:Sua5/YciO/YrdC/YwlC family protein [Moraxella macacae]ELA09157.1 SUA5/yciO/yrdC-like protein [Moraxella macacae 0408225]